MKIEDALCRFREELGRAQRKFPGFPTDPVHAAAVLVEEAGDRRNVRRIGCYEGRNGLQ